MLTTMEKVIFLGGIPEFSEIPMEQLRHIASITEEMELEPDTAVIKQNEPAEALYFVIEGQIRMERDGKEFTTLKAKEVIGRLSLFDNEMPNVATAVTTEPTMLLKINREDFLEVLADYVEITQGIFKSLVRKMRNVVID